MMAMNVARRITAAMMAGSTVRMGSIPFGGSDGRQAVPDYQGSVDRMTHRIKEVVDSVWTEGAAIHRVTGA